MGYNPYTYFCTYAFLGPYSVKGPEDVLKIIEDVAEKLAGKKLPDSVAAGVE